MASEGVDISRRADGGRTFALETPEPTWIRIDHQTRLQFGKAELVIETPFTLKVGEETVELDPGDRASLGRLLNVYPDTTRELSMSPDGMLTVEFASRRELIIRPDPRFEAWGIAGFSCPPGGY